jgi:hypothetical protein
MLPTILFLGTLCGQMAGETPIISPATKDEAGVLTHEVKSEYQAGTTKIRVLLPKEIEADARLRVIYVLPVEAQEESRFGNGLAEVQKLDLHNKHSVIFVAPTFSHLPWYADHPSDKAIRQETYFVKVVLPFIEKTYPVLVERRGRLLLGFSKSGWGAWSLLLRQPELFERAVAWDAPLMMDRPGKYGSGDIFDSEDNFANYHLTELVAKRAGELGDQPRLILTGYGNFRREHEQMHALLDKLKLPYVYRDGPQLKHHWAGGWVEEAVELLVKDPQP